MRKAYLIALGLTFAVTAAQAQGSRRDDWDGDRWRDDRREWREDRGARHDDDDDRRERRFMRGDRSGARFFVRSGDTRVGMVCDTGESMRACVDAALTLLDRARQGASSTAAPSSAPSASPSAPSPR